MNTLFKLAVIALALMMVAYLLQCYVPSWYAKVAFTAPIVGAMSYAGCIIVGLGSLLMAKLSFGK